MFKEWRKSVGMVPSGIWMAIVYAGSFFEDYWLLFIFEAIVMASTTYFFAHYWSAFYRKKSRQVDAIYYIPSRKELLLAHTYALEQIKELGMEYIERWCDCDDLAEAVCFFMKAWFRSHMTHKGKGLAIAPFGYDKDKGKVRGHVCVEAIAETMDGRMYFEVFYGYGELNLSKTEKGTGQWQNF
jgi:hypothetical protein